MTGRRINIASASEFEDTVGYSRAVRIGGHIADIRPVTSMVEVAALISPNCSWRSRPTPTSAAEWIAAARNARPLQAHRLWC